MLLYFSMWCQSWCFCRFFFWNPE